MNAKKPWKETSATLVKQSFRERPPITWQTPVSTLLPEDFVLPTPELTKIVTVEDILSHRIGMPSCDNASFGWGDELLVLSFPLVSSFEGTMLLRGTGPFRLERAAYEPS